MVKETNSKVVPELATFRNDDNYKLEVASSRGTSSKWMTMGFYNDQLIMKQQKEKTIEIAG
tara:strand:+ start:166 stop:348 length:183 start_codon:yes stop_codon:yes gene_type:complete